MAIGVGQTPSQLSITTDPYLNYGVSGFGRDPYTDLLMQKALAALDQRQYAKRFRPAAPEGEGSDRATARKFEMERMQRENAEDEAKFRALTTPPPTKETTVGTQTFPTMDTQDMNAFQRRAYLPSGSSFARGGEGDPMSDLASRDTGSTAVPNGPMDPTGLQQLKALRGMQAQGQGG